MRFLDKTLNTAAENVALDEALLEEAEAADRPREVLRIWESAAPLVVIGRSSPADAEVDLAACRELGIPVLRRVSGGAAIVTGPGCLMYAVVLSFELRPELKAIDKTHHFVLGRLVDALRRRIPTVAHHGTSDLAVGENPPRKFSGNSVRLKRTHVLYHGTLLYDLPLKVVAAVLKTAPRQPQYRASRNHLEFVANLPIARADLKEAVRTAFPTTESLTDWPAELTNQLVAEKYSQQQWNLER
jgi:lipoate-protein ligase A